MPAKYVGSAMFPQRTRQGNIRDVQDSSTVRAVQQTTILKVQLGKISEFVAAISVVLTDDPTISLLKRTQPDRLKDSINLISPKAAGVPLNSY